MKSSVTYETARGGDDAEERTARAAYSAPALEKGLDILELLAEAGLEKVERHNRSLVAQFLESYPKNRFQLASPDSGSNIICLSRKEGSFEPLMEQLRAAGTYASVREGNLRLAFHLFNTEDEVKRLVGLLNSLKLG